MDERIKSLEMVCNLALKRMQTDGLAKQLDAHEKSCEFVPRRLAEVMADYINLGREREIQKVTNDIDNAIFQRDRSETKLRKAHKQAGASQQQIREQHKELNKTKEQLARKVSDLRRRNSIVETGQDDELIARERRIRQSKVSLAKTRASLSSLAADLSEMRANVSLMAVSSVKVIRTAFNKIIRNTLRHRNERQESLQQYVQRTLGAKQYEQLKLSHRLDRLHSSIDQIRDFVDHLLDGAPQDFGEQRDMKSTILNRVIPLQEEQFIKKHFQNSQINLSVLNYRPEVIAKAAKHLYDTKIQEKETELNEIVAQARKQRLKLQAELDRALEQCQSLQGSVDANISVTEIEHNDDDFQATRQQLDATLNQLGKELGARLHDVQ